MSEEAQQQQQATTGDQGQQQQQQAQQPDHAAELAKLTRERDEAIARAHEHEEAARFWHGKVRGTAEVQPDKPKPEDEDGTDLLEVAAKGPAAMKEWLRKQGFVSMDEANQLVNSRAEQLSREGQLIQSYPDLKDHDSEFFKETATEYGRLKQQGVPEAVAMEVAAERVRARRKPSQEEKVTSSKKETDADRAARAKAQAGEGTKRGAKAQEDTADLSDEQKRIIEAFGISEDAYRKRATDGVQFARQ